MIEIRYSCHECGIVDAGVTVRFRESTEAVVAWMRQVVEPALSADHRARSPHCCPETLSEVKIPVPAGTDYVGGPQLQ
jgi:hypothetical protein